jgi:hypothetical protein
VLLSTPIELTVPETSLDWPSTEMVAVSPTRSWPTSVSVTAVLTSSFPEPITVIVAVLDELVTDCPGLSRICATVPAIGLVRVAWLRPSWVTERFAVAASICAWSAASC